MGNLENLLTITEVADRLRVNHTTVRKWIKQKYLKAISLPSDPDSNRKTYRVREETLNELLIEE